MTTPPDAAPSHLLTYGEALHRLLSLADFERVAGTASRRPSNDLGRMRDLAKRLGDPQHCAPVLHIAGTKGKGSVAAMSASILRSAGLRVGLFTSPHLHTFRERISLDGGPLSEQRFAETLDAVWPHVEAMAPADSDARPTTFEALTAMAFHLFAQERVDAQVIEVGLGGRLDSTNVADATVAVITSLSRDHAAILGDTIEAIAGEKAGIIKPGSVVVCAPQPEAARAVVDAAAKEQGARVLHLGSDVTWEGGEHDLTGQSLVITSPQGPLPLWMPLLGSHQQENAAAAVAATRCLVPDLAPSAVESGLREVRWGGRFQVLARNPAVVVDGAHNAYSAGRLRQTVEDYLRPERVILVCGCSVDKELAAMARELGPIVDQVVACASRHPRSVVPSGISEAFALAGTRATAGGAVANAMELALGAATAEDLVLVTGSLFVVAEALEYWDGLEPERYPELEPAGPPEVAPA